MSIGGGILKGAEVVPKTSVTISKTNHDTIIIQLRDQASRINFAQVSLTLTDYAHLITGLAEVEGDGKYRLLEHVGKTKIIEKRCVSLYVKFSNRGEAEQWLIDNAQEEGWHLDSYLGAQGSINCESNNTTTLRYSVYKYEYEYHD